MIATILGWALAAILAILWLRERGKTAALAKTVKQLERKNKQLTGGRTYVSTLRERKPLP
jgi:uncharacterized membrane protein YciS (DUF1049 family)